MQGKLQKENRLLRNEIRVLHEASELTAELVIEQFEKTELEKHRYREAAVYLEGFKRTLDLTSDCVFMFDRDTYFFTYVNNGGLQLTGYSEEELYSMTFESLDKTFTVERMNELFHPLLQKTDESLLLETTQKRKNGVEVPVEIFVQYISPSSIEGRFFFHRSQYFKTSAGGEGKGRDAGKTSAHPKARIRWFSCCWNCS